MGCGGVADTTGLGVFFGAAEVLCVVNGGC